MKILKGYAAFLILLTLFSPPVLADGGDFGLGVVVGAPTGISANFKLERDRAIDAVLAYDFSDENNSLVVMADYLIKNPRSIKLDNEMLGWYWGVGGRYKQWEDDDDDDDDDFRIGPRALIGLDYQLRTAPVEFIAELGVILNIVPKTDADITAGIGARYYF